MAGSEDSRSLQNLFPAKKSYNGFLDAESGAQLMFLPVALEHLVRLACEALQEKRKEELRSLENLFPAKKAYNYLLDANSGARLMVLHVALEHLVRLACDALQGEGALERRSGPGISPAHVALSTPGP
ncbi:unnamed protein product [Parajaminaea phylloscopi]